MKLVRSLPLLLAPLTALAVTLQEGRQPAQTAPPVREGVRGNPDQDQLPPGVGNRDVGALDIFGRPTLAGTDTLSQRIQGGWRMTEMEMLGSHSGGRKAVGFLNVGNNFLSLEIHASWEGDTKSIEYDIHLVFTAEYTLDSTGKMMTRSVIGSFIEEETGRLQWEKFGFPREFFVTETSKGLVLTFDRGRSRLGFVPRAPRMVGRTDIFGRREILEPGDNSFGTDIFGRKAPESTGVRDIFGRAVPAQVPGEDDATDGDGQGDQKEVIDLRTKPPGK